MKLSDKIYVAGNGGMVGSAIERALRAAGYGNVIGRTHRELDLANQAQTLEFFMDEKPDVAVIAAAKSAAYTPTPRIRRSLSKSTSQSR